MWFTATLLVPSCKSEQSAAPEASDDEIVSARIGRANLRRGPRQQLEAHPTDPEMGSDENDPDSASASDRVVASTASSNGSRHGGSSGSNAGGNGSGGSESSRGGSAGDGEGSSGGDAQSSESAGNASGGSPGESGDGATGSNGASGAAATQSAIETARAGADRGAQSGSQDGDTGSASDSPSGETGASSSSASEPCGSDAGSGQSGSGGGAGGGDSQAAGDAQSGEGEQGESGSGSDTAASGSAQGAAGGVATPAGGSGTAGGIGEQGTVRESSDDYIQPSGSTSDSGAASPTNAAGGPPPQWIEPEAMEGSAEQGGAEASGATGGGDRRRDATSTAGGNAGANDGGRGDGRPDPEAPPAPEGSLGVAHSAESAESTPSDRFLDDTPEVQDFPLEVEKEGPDTADSQPPASLEASEVAGATESIDAPVHDSDPGADRPQASLESVDADAETSPLGDAVSIESDLDSAAQHVDEPAKATQSGSLSGPSSSDQTAPDSPSSDPPITTGSGTEQSSGEGDAQASDREQGDALASEDASSRTVRRELIAMPEVDAAPIELRSLRDRVEPTLPDDPRWALRGAWEQINLARNGADFAPGGYERQVIAIDPEQETLKLYRVFANGAYVAAGEFRVEVMPNGDLELRVDEKLPHLFLKEPFTIDGVEVVPPVEPIAMTRRWLLADGVLQIGDRRFTRIDRDAFESVSRGTTAASESIDRGGFAASSEVIQDADPPAAVDFFGTSIVGRHICFVVDVSGSMAGPRLEAALTELARSINALPADRLFYVLFFSGSTLVLEDRWTRASPSLKRKFIAKLAGIEAQGGTEPVSALEHAFRRLAPVPDEIHFMTDGLIPVTTAGRLRDLNSGRVRTVIHTYAFGESASEPMLREIAADHGGQYRFVPQ